MLELRGPAMATGDYGRGATIDLFRKDLAVIAGFASQVDAATPLLNVVAQLYERAASAGHGDDELASIHATYIEQR